MSENSKISNNNKELVFWMEFLWLFLKPVLLLLFGLLLLYFIDWGFLRNEITDYIIDCPPDLKACYTLRHNTYKVDSERQEVVEQTEGFPPEKLTDCAVRDRTNWKCKYNDKSGTFGFSGGRYFEYSDIKLVTDDLVKHWKHVSRLQYLQVKWLSAI